MTTEASNAPALHVDSSGEGAPVVLLHSSGLSGRQWRRLVPALVEKGFRAVVPDLLGHGASAEWPEPKAFSFRDDVAALTALLEAQGPAHVVGHSYGAFLALVAARQSPRLVRTMVLFEPVAFGVLDPAADSDARDQLLSIDFHWGPLEKDRERWLRTFVDYWGGEGAWLALREEARAEFRRVAWVVHEGVRTLMEDTAPPAAYQPIKSPVRLMSGELSPLAARRVVERLSAALPDARYVTIGGVGHMAPLSHTDVVNPGIVAALLMSP